MNPVGAEGNMFANLFDKVPAKRAGKLEDISGTVLYLCSQAGVSEFVLRIVFQHADHMSAGIRGWTLSLCRWRESLGCQWTGMNQ